MLRKKYKKCKEDTAKDIIKLGVHTCILKIELTATSKIEDHFIYEVCYLDDNELKVIPVVGKNINNVIELIEPYIKVNKSEQWMELQFGSEDAVKSRIKSN